MAEEKTGAAKHSKDYRDRQKMEMARLGIERIHVDMPERTRQRFAEAMKAHGYSQLQELLQNLHLSFLAADLEEQSRQLKRPDATAFRITPKLSRQFEDATKAELRCNPGDEIIPPDPRRSALHG